MRAQPRWGVLPLLAAPVGTWALGLGDIELQSALNQPFQAQIALVSPTAEDLQGLSVTLANQATFERYGLERPAYLSNLSFRVGRDEAGRSVILIRSAESVAEPFVTLLVEATWPSGRSLREYTVLLDPPLLLPRPAVETPVQPAQSRAPGASAPGGAIERPAPQPAPRAVPPQPAPQVPPPPASVSDGGSYGPVQRAETLWAIASQRQPGGVSINQMMLAIYRANPQAFDDNINLLRQGAVLRIPSAAEAGSLTAANATAEVRRQNEAWLGGGPQQARLRLVPPSDEPAALGPGGDAAGSAEADSLRNELNATQSELEESRRLLELRNQELEQLQNQLAEARSSADAPPDAAVDGPEPAAADPGVDLEVEEQIFADESAVEVPPSEAEAVEPAPGAEPSATRTPAAVTTPEQSPSLVSRVIDIATQPFVLIGVGVGVLLLAALLFLRRKRDDDVDDVTGRWEALEAEAEAEEDEIAATTRLRKRAEEQDDFVVVEAAREEPDSDDRTASLLADSDFDDVDDFTRTRPPAAEAPEAADETLSSQTVINLDQADPIAEADFHMAYGLYDQAAELVSKALEAQPDNRGLKLKLLEVFFVWGNKEAFLDAAQALRTEMGHNPDGDWDKVIIMGKQICPDEALFADATAAAGEVDLDLEAGSEPALDLAFDDQASSDDEDTGTHTSAADDLDLDFGDDSGFGSELALESTGERTSSRSTADDDESDDLDGSLDIGAQTSAGLEAALFGIDDDAASATTPDVEVDFDSLAETQESPTVESEQNSLDDEDWAGVTMESPTVETAGPEGDTVEMSAVGDDEDYDSATMESPTIESPTVEREAAYSDPTVESPTVESEAPEQPTVEQTGLHSSADLTAELDLDDLGLDVQDLENLPTDLGDLPSADDASSDTREQPALRPDEDDDDLLSATGVTQVLRSDEEGLDALNTAVLGDDDATMMAPGLGDDSMSSKTLSSTEVLDAVPDEAADKRDESGVDLNLDDLSSALEGGDTVEQPRASSFGGDVFGGAGHTPVDLDVGDDVLGSDDPTGTEEVNLDPQTMTEVGTKLDLARAYIDMGDPEGARSILEEVLDEGDSGQKREAQTLIDVLSA